MNTEEKLVIARQLLRLNVDVIEAGFPISSPGESIYYDSIVPHQVRAHNGQNAKFLACVYTPF